MVYLEDIGTKNIFVEREKESIAIISRYFFVFIGCIFSFMVSANFNLTLMQAITMFGISLCIMILIHKYDKEYLCYPKMSMGILLRCVGFSWTVAQYFLISYQLNCFVKNIESNIKFSIKGLLVMGTIYIIIFFLYMPENGAGRRIIRKYYAR